METDNEGDSKVDVRVKSPSALQSGAGKQLSVPPGGLGAPLVSEL